MTYQPRPVLILDENVLKRADLRYYLELNRLNDDLSIGISYFVKAGKELPTLFIVIA